MKYYITTTLPYVNAKPHIGFALEIIQADALARYHRLQGDEVIFNTGTDEHGIKILNKAKEEGKEIQVYVDEYAKKFDNLKKSLNLSYTNFIRTTDKHHIKAAQEFWKLCEQNGDIYKKNYQTKYCVGCELEKTDSELVDGKCPVHPNLELELIDEENYFFRFSNYENKLLELYENNPDFVVPNHRLNEIREFVRRGLQDFSISRLKSKMPWGVEVPGDAEHVMYVWFDALVNYISTLGWSSYAEASEDKPNLAKATEGTVHSTSKATEGTVHSTSKATEGKPNQFAEFWPGVQVAGKDNLRQQTAMWQAMLMSAGLPNSKQIFIHGFITSGGQKMSKSLGNVIDPFEIQEKYGTDALRYFLLGGVSAYEDGDFTIERFEEFYTAHLVNGVGNLTSRILTMIEKYSEGKTPNKSSYKFEPKNGALFSGIFKFNLSSFWEMYQKSLELYSFASVVEFVNKWVQDLDSIITEQEPWAKVKNGEDISDLLYQLAEGLRHIGLSLLPIIPETAEKILNGLGVKEINKLNLEKEKEWGRLTPKTKITKPDILFPRLKEA